MTTILNSLEWLAKYGFIDIIFGIGVIGIIIRIIHRFLPRNLNHIHLHLQPQEMDVKNDIEEYKNVLGIFISNAGLKNVYIARAFFRPKYRIICIFSRKSKLSIYPKAFKSAAHKAYELKFGYDYWEFDTLIKPGKRVYTYLPLAKPPNNAVLANRNCGTIILEYATAGQSGRHVVRV